MCNSASEEGRSHLSAGKSMLGELQLDFEIIVADLASHALPRRIVLRISNGKTVAGQHVATR